MSIVYTRSARADIREISRYYATVNRQYGTRLSTPCASKSADLRNHRGAGGYARSYPRVCEAMSCGRTSFFIGSAAAGLP